MKTASRSRGHRDAGRPEKYMKIRAIRAVLGFAPRITHNPYKQYSNSFSRDSHQVHKHGNSIANAEVDMVSNPTGCSAAAWGCFEIWVSRSLDRNTNSHALQTTNARAFCPGALNAAMGYMNSLQGMGMAGQAWPTTGAVTPENLAGSSHTASLYRHDVHRLDIDCYS